MKNWTKETLVFWSGLSLVDWPRKLEVDYCGVIVKAPTVKQWAEAAWNFCSGRIHMFFSEDQSIHQWRHWINTRRQFLVESASGQWAVRDYLEPNYAVVGARGYGDTTLFRRDDEHYQRVAPGGNYSAKQAQAMMRSSASLHPRRRPVTDTGTAERNDK